MIKLSKLAVISACLALFVCACDKDIQNSNNKDKTTLDEKKVVFVDWGGPNTQARIDKNLKPFEQQTGIKVEVVTPSDYKKLMNMVEYNETCWDVVNTDSYFAIHAGKQGYLEAIDYSIVTENLYDKAKLEYVVEAEVYSSVIAYNLGQYQEAIAPKTWKDFFDTQKFPGKRALWKHPVTVLEAALLADGVEPNNLYPLDIKRAIAKLDSIKDSIIWWTDGDEPIKMLTDGDIDFALAWSGRVIHAQDIGAPLDFTYNQGLRVNAGWVVPKGAPHKDNAMKLINFLSNAKMQAAFSRAVAYGSTNPDALKLLPKGVLYRIGQIPELTKKHIYVDNLYWAENYEEVSEIFNKWISENF